MSRPRVMGILNLTPDSFHADSRVAGEREAVERARMMLAQGAFILDIGACSSRPGSEPVSAEEELSRLRSAVPAIRRELPEALVSIDTFRAEVAEVCLAEWGVDIINDISGGEDPGMFPVVARHSAAYVLMHMRGTPADMDSRCRYGDVVADVVREIAFRLDGARRAGICNVIVDPGFGFAKTVDQNLALLKHLDFFSVLGCPILAGISRKRMAVSLETPDSLASTIALNAVAVDRGAHFIRVHDVPEAVAVVNSVGRLWNLE